MIDIHVFGQPDNTRVRAVRTVGLFLILNCITQIGGVFWASCSLNFHSPRIRLLTWVARRGPLAPSPPPPTRCPSAPPPPRRCLRPRLCSPLRAVRDGRTEGRPQKRVGGASRMGLGGRRISFVCEGAGCPGPGGGGRRTRGWNALDQT